MKLLSLDFFFQIYAEEIDGIELIWRKNVFTNDIEYLLTDELAQMNGFDSVEAMMMDNDMLDAMNEFKEQYGVFPVQ